MPLDMPRAGARAFGAARETHRHNGVDFAAREGETVRAAAPGRVRWATWQHRPGFAGYGRVVVIAADDGTEHLYSHLQRPLVTDGQRVAANEAIGLAGHTQYSNDDPTDARSSMGPHLHFEVAQDSYPLRNDVPRLDPLAYLELGRFHPIAGVRVAPAAPAPAPPAELEPVAQAPAARPRTPIVIDVPAPFVRIPEPAAAEPVLPPLPALPPMRAPSGFGLLLAAIGVSLGAAALSGGRRKRWA